TAWPTTSTSAARTPRALWRRGTRTSPSSRAVSSPPRRAGTGRWRSSSSGAPPTRSRRSSRSRGAARAPTGSARRSGSWRPCARGVDPLCRLAAEPAAIHLARRQQRQLDAKLDGTRQLVRRDPILQPGEERLGADGRAGSEPHEGVGQLTRGLVGGGDHAGLGDLVLLEERALDLGREAVDPAHDDRRAQTADEPEGAVRAGAHQVAGPQPAVGAEDLGGRLRHAVVALHDPGTTDPELAHLGTRCTEERRWRRREPGAPPSRDGGQGWWPGHGREWGRKWTIRRRCSGAQAARSRLERQRWGRRRRGTS